MPRVLAWWVWSVPCDRKLQRVYLRGTNTIYITQRLTYRLRNRFNKPHLNMVHYNLTGRDQAADKSVISSPQKHLQETDTSCKSP